MKTLDSTERHIIDSGFLDTGGAADYAAFNMCTTDVIERKIYIRDTMFWKLNEKEKITFGSIRNDIAILHQQLNFSFIGCETNNYGRTEIESLKRDYSIKIHPVNTVGKLTDQKKIMKGESMEKNAIIKFVNSWRQNAIDDPNNELKLGQIITPIKKTEGMRRWESQLDSFVRKNPEGFGSTALPKFAAEGSGHDDGIMASLGNIFLIKTKLFNIYGGAHALGTVIHGESLDPVRTQENKPTGRAIGFVEQGMYDL